MRKGDFQPWDRQPGESPQAWAGFQIYRDMGPAERSHAKVASEMGRRRNSINKWSRKYQWVDRVTVWDKHCDQIKQEKQRKEIEEMAERHARIAVLAQTKVLQGLQALQPNAISASAIVSMFDVAVKVERLARGFPTQSTEISGPDRGPIPIEERRLDSMTNAEIEALIRAYTENLDDS